MKNKTLLALIVLLLGISSIACNFNQNQKESEKPKLVSILPKDNEIPSWKKEAKAFVAKGFDELAQRINGGAPFYIDRGVKKSVFQNYINENNDIWIELIFHQTATIKEAKRLYQDIYAESPEFLPSLGDGGRKLPKLIGAYALEFRKGSVFVNLTITDKSAKSQTVLMSFAKKISDKLKR
ncbi:MAG: hypothetical protein GY729_06420 [Desulfobacteraceae bacterium]|nr:hypothetical protein [Desulfobacteraceae bacterium]